MPRIRVHQLAKELEIDSKVILEEAAKHGISVKNHMSSLSESDEFMLRAFLETVRPIVPAPERSAPMPPPISAPPSPAARPPMEGAPRSVVATRPGAPRPPIEEPMRSVAAARPETPAEPRSVVARPPGKAPPPMREVRARPGEPADQPHRPREVQARPASAPPRHPEAPAASAQPNPTTRAHPPSVQAIPTATARPPRPGDSTLVQREPTNQRRQAEILGRKELPPQRPPQRGRPGGGQGGFNPGGPGAAGGGGGSAGSGLIATRSEGGKRTFVVTGRGRGGPGRPGGGNAPRTGPPSRGGASFRETRERRMTKPKTMDLSASTPDVLTVELPITVKGLSERLGVKANILIQRLFKNHSKMLKINDPVDKDTIELLGLEFDCEITCVAKIDVETRVMEQLEKRWESTDAGDLSWRAPIVAFLGHVDHGKTSLLDAIRKTNVASREHGGITQHIGATRVELPEGKAVVFLDTPGHRAFTEMRARGAQVTDVVVLVVAADDGVMPQTKEAIAHARAAKTPIVVAMNKIDRPDANPLKVRQELANEGLQDETWGGSTIIVETSATTGKGIDDLLEALLLESEVLELKANRSRPAVATVIEAEQSRGEGNMARLVINDGTLRKGDIFVCGTAHGRIRAIKTSDGRFLDEAGPAWPVEITGLNDLPSAGDRLLVLKDQNEAKEIATKRVHLAREKEIAKASHVSLENLFDKLKGKALKLILKVDVSGSLEVLQREINQLEHPEIRSEVIHAAVGGITETDVTLADASDAVILGFHVSADMGARRLADQKGVEIRIYQVIYKLMDELKDAMEGRLAPEEKEVITGEAEIRATWKVSKLGIIAGCYVQSGVVKKASRVRISRDGIVIHDNGHLESLKRVKDDVRDVKEGFECGMIVANFSQIEVGDVITAYEIQKVRRTFDATA